MIGQKCDCFLNSTRPHDLNFPSRTSTMHIFRKVTSLSCFQTGLLDKTFKMIPGQIGQYNSRYNPVWPYWQSQSDCCSSSYFLMILINIDFFASYSNPIIFYTILSISPRRVQWYITNHPNQTNIKENIAYLVIALSRPDA